MSVYTTYANDCALRNAVGRATWASKYFLRCARDMRDLRTDAERELGRMIEHKVRWARQYCWANTMRELRKDRRKFREQVRKIAFLRPQAG